MNDGRPGGRSIASVALLTQGALPTTGWRQTFSSLSGNRDFAYLFAGNVGFFFGMNMMMILSGWLVIDRWDNAAYLGYVMATVAIPMLFFAPIGGVVTDRVDKRKLLFLTQSLLVCTSCTVCILILTDAIRFWHLLVITPVSGTAFAFNMPGRQALLAMLVPRDRLMNAISLSTAAMNASRIVAPPLAGLLVAPVGIGGAYVVATVCYASAVVATIFLPPVRPRRVREFTFFEDLTGGFSYIRRSDLLLGLLLFATVPMIFAMPYQTLLPVFADDVWHVGASGLGVMQAMSGVGGLIGGLMVANMDGYPRKGRMMFLASMVTGTFLIAFALSPIFGVALVPLAIVGLSSMVFMTVNNTVVTSVIPDEVRGRVMSVMMMSFGLMPFGAVPASIAAAYIGTPAVVALGGGLLMLTVMAFYALYPQFREIDGVIQTQRADRDAEYAGSPESRPAPAAGR